MEGPEQQSKSQIVSLDGQKVDETVIAGSQATGKSGMKSRLDGVVIDQKYRLIGLLGEGGMGAVYKAHHLMLDKEVALKTFRSPNLAEDSWQRFQREAKAIASLSHINIVQVFDFGVGEDNVPYYTMECLTGETLADRLARTGALPLRQTIEIFLQVCDALSVAHSKGIVHRDLKPANIFLVRDQSPTSKSDLVKIVDFGLAGLASQSLAGQKLTTTGTVFGSPLYMSPEQSMGQSITPRSDIYSCGCALFATLAGSPPFQGENAFATMLKHQQSPAPKLTKLAGGEAVPPRLEALLESMLAKKESERIESFSKTREELEKILKGDDFTDVTDGHVSAPLRSREPDQSVAEEQGPLDSRRGTFVLIFIASLSIVAALVFMLINQRSKAPTTTIHSQDETSKTATNNLSVAPYLQNPQTDKYQPRNFIFPKDQSLGQLFLLEGDPVVARPTPLKVVDGAVTIPVGGQLKLIAAEPLSDHPQLFSGFGADDLLSLGLNGRCTWSDEHFSYISRLTGLSRLDMSNAEVSGRCIDDINKLTKLNVLFIDKTPLTDADLAKLECLPKLVKLSISKTTPLTDTLTKIAKSQAMRFISLMESKLTDGQMQIIATMPNLEIIHINRNSEITDQGLSYIGRLSKLRELQIRDTGIGPSSIATLRKFRGLRKLAIDYENWPPADQQALKSALPECTLIAKGTGSEEVAFAMARFSEGQPKSISSSLETKPTTNGDFIKPFLQNPGAKAARQPLKFIFPTGQSLGELSWLPLSSSQGPDKIQRKAEASGQVIVPPNGYLQLVAKDPLSDDPRLFGGFRRDDLDHIVLFRDCVWTNSHMAYLCNLTGLHSLTITESNISDDCIDNLNKLNKLTSLQLKNVKISGLALAKLPCLSQLSYFSVSHNHTIANALPKLTNSKASKMIEIIECDLTDRDLPVFATLPNLTMLDLSENPKITNRGIQSICHLPKLRILKLRQTGVTPDSVKMLKTLPALERLIVPAKLWGDADPTFLKTSLPGCKIDLRAEPDNSGLKEFIKNRLF